MLEPFAGEFWTGIKFIMKYFFRPYATTAALFILFSLAFGQPVWASIPPTHDSISDGWQAYEAGRFSDAFSIWEKLASKGDMNAQLNLGIMYDTGQGVAADPVKAFTWYLAAAEKGSPDAQYTLGLMFNAGRGVTSDVGQAAHWFYQAALHNLPMAQYELGSLYANGLDTNQVTLSPAGQPFISSGSSSIDGVELAVRWYFTSGVSYLAQGNSKDAWRAIKAIDTVAKKHPLKQDLQEKMHCDMAENNPASPVKSYAGGSIGTGWPIATGYVVTNSHVVKGSTNVLLISESGQELQAWIVLRDEAHDIALLEVRDIAKLPPAIPLSGAQADLGASVFTVGYPRIDMLGDTPKHSQGAISQLHGLQDDPFSYQTTVPIQPGNSGGPLINMRGEAVGVIKAMIGIRDDIGGQLKPLPNASCALKIDSVKELALLLPQQQPLLGELSHSPDDMSTLAARIKGSVLIVVAR